MKHLILNHPWSALFIAGFLIALLMFFVGCVLRVAGTHDEPVPVGASNAESRASNETQIQERTNALAWIVFTIFALWSSASYWLRFKRVCAWHTPNPIRMGGNPIARKVTHGICPTCFARVSGEIAAHEPELKSKAV